MSNGNVAIGLYLNKTDLNNSQRSYSEFFLGISVFPYLGSFDSENHTN